MPPALICRDYPFSLADCKQVSCYGFSRLPKLTTEFTSDLPRETITVHGCFVSQAAFDSTSRRYWADYMKMADLLRMLASEVKQ